MPHTCWRRNKNSIDEELGSKVITRKMLLVYSICISTLRFI